MKLSDAERARLTHAAEKFDTALAPTDTSDIEQALFDGLVAELPEPPASWLRGPLAQVTAPLALLRRVLFALSRFTATAAGVMYDVDDWPFDVETGAPLSAPPRIDNPLLITALVTAARGQRVHPLCVLAVGRCDCPAHGEQCPGNKPRWPDWRKRATVTPSQIFAWWAQWPDAGVGRAGGAVISTQQPERDRARQLLVEMIDEKGTARQDIMVEAVARGLKEATVGRAADDLGVRKQRGEPRRKLLGFFDYSIWYPPEGGWPAPPPPAPELVANAVS